MYNKQFSVVRTRPVHASFEERLGRVVAGLPRIPASVPDEALSFVVGMQAQVGGPHVNPDQRDLWSTFSPRLPPSPATRRLVRCGRSACLRRHAARTALALGVLSAHRPDGGLRSGLVGSSVSMVMVAAVPPGRHQAIQVLPLSRSFVMRSRCPARSGQGRAHWSVSLLARSQLAASRTRLLTLSSVARHSKTQDTLVPSHRYIVALIRRLRYLSDIKPTATRWQPCCTCRASELVGLAKHLPAAP